MSSLLEHDKFPLYKLCYLLKKRFKYDLTYRRAQYRVSYYRKKLAKLENKQLSAYEKYDRLELAKKIEQARLIALKKQKELIQAKTKLNGPINKIVNKVNAQVIADNGNILEVRIMDGSGPWHKMLYSLNADKIEEYALQFEADRALNRILTNKTGCGACLACYNNQPCLEM